MFSPTSSWRYWDPSRWFKNLILWRCSGGYQMGQNNETLFFPIYTVFQNWLKQKLFFKFKFEFLNEYFSRYRTDRKLSLNDCVALWRHESCISLNSILNPLNSIQMRWANHKKFEKILKCKFFGNGSYEKAFHWDF